MAPSEFSQQARKEIVSGADHGDVELAARDAFDLLHGFFGLAELLDDRAAVMEHLRSGLREIDLSAQLLEQA